MARPKTHLHDRILAATVLRLFPRTVTANHLTLFRLVATPFVLILLHEGHLFWTLVSFFLVASTDVLDGSMARTRDRVTAWGTLWDPIADKVLIASVAGLLILDHFPLLLVLLIVVTEIAFLFLGYLRIRAGHEVTANVWSKSKMLLQVIGLCLFLISLMLGSEPFAYASYAAFIAATTFALVNILQLAL